MISLPPWLEARRRGGLSGGQGATSLLVAGWVSSTCLRAVVCVASVGPALGEVGYCEWTSVLCCWMPGLSCQPTSLLSCNQVLQHPRSPPAFANRLSLTGAGDIFLVCWRQSPSYSLKSSAGQGLAVLSPHKSKHCWWILLLRPNSAPGLLLCFLLPPP